MCVLKFIYLFFLNEDVSLLQFFIFSLDVVKPFTLNDIIWTEQAWDTLFVHCKLKILECF